MTAHRPWFWLLAFVLAFASALAWSVAASADPPKPVITTPTPYPTATPKAPTARELLALTPAAQRRGGFTYLPLAGRNAGSAPLDVNPESFTYVVRPGDTLWTLALDFGRDLDTMACATTPTGADAETLTPGQTITVPALRDLCYTVTPGDTLAVVAAQFGLTVDTIGAVPWNGFAVPPYLVQPRQRVLLPGVRLDSRPRPDRRAMSYATDAWAASVPDWPFGDGRFIWPVSGPISQDAHTGHVALDIAVPLGTPIKAADRGTVVMAGWSSVGYGFRVVIDHGIDYVTLYAHLSDIYVAPGQVVGKGQVIGVSGANGNVTGPHLHFEIRDFGQLVDPLTLLP
ncbi:MAG: M23 family metallopeptidase [Chloroflexi bacterium]|nr:M23 family metallopeptidase [Chloroflexota bacterium]